MVIRLRKAHFMSVMWEHGEVIGCTTRILKEGLWNQGIHRYTYIMVDTEFDVRWMTDEESWEYVKEKDMRLMMEEYAKFDNKKNMNKYMKYKVMAVIAVLCLMAVGCKQKPKEELLEIEGVEQFELHHEWTEDNLEAFWE